MGTWADVDDRSGERVSARAGCHAALALQMQALTRLSSAKRRF
jgi:hypothetical protein